MKKVVVNILIQVFVQIHVSIYLEQITRTGHAGPQVDLCFTYQKMSAVLQNGFIFHILTNKERLLFYFLTNIMFLAIYHVRSSVSMWFLTSFSLVTNNIEYIFFFFFFIYFYQLEANYFTILQWFLPYIDMNQPWIYMGSPSRSPSHLPLHPIPLGLPSAPALSTCRMHPSWAWICFTLDSILVSMLFLDN